MLQYYSEELTLLTYALEDGIEVTAYELIQSQNDFNEENDDENNNNGKYLYIKFFGYVYS